MGHETHQKDSYNIYFGMIGGRKNKYNSPSYGKPSPHGESEHNNNYNINNNDDDDDDSDDHDNYNHYGQSQPSQQELFQPYPSYPSYQCPPPQYPDQLAVGGYHGDSHVSSYPGSFVPHQGGYGSHGGGEHMKKDVGLLGAAIGVASFGVFKLLRECLWAGRRRHGGGY